MRRSWTEPRPFDHADEFYSIEGAHADIRCDRQSHIPIYGGGGSDAAITVLAPHVDIFMLWGEPLAATARFMARVREAGTRHGRTPGFSLSTRPILAETDDKAWDRAHLILEQV